MGQQTDAVILARVSSKAQEDEGYSLDSQLKLLIGYCERNSLNVIRAFKIAETASKEQSRKVFHELMEYITEKGVYHLAVEKTDRFTRNFRDAVAIDEWLEQDENRRLHAVKENLLLHKNAKSDVKFMWNIHISVAKKYTDNLREEALKGWTEKLQQGWLPAPPPPGYMSITENGKRIHVPDPETKDLMRQVFRKYLEPGQTIRTITAEMRQLGITTRAGRYYAKSHVQKILTNPFYIGINRFDGKDYPGVQETIITGDLFDRVQQKMHKGRPKTFTIHDPPLKGMIRCIDCDSAITWQLQKGRYYGVCRRLTVGCKRGKMLREDRVEAQLQVMLKDLVCPSREVINWVAGVMRNQHQSSIENRERLVKSTQAQIDRTSRMDDMLYDDKLSGDITKEKYEVKHEQFMKQKAELTDKLNNMEATAGNRLEQRLVLLELSQQAAEIYASKPPDKKRLIVSKLFDQMTLKDGILSVSYSNFARAIADKVEKTRNIMEVKNDVPNN